MRIIKNIVPLMLAVFLALGTQAQSKSELKEQKKKERVAKKQERASLLEQNKEKILSMVEDSTFIIEASQLYDRYNRRYEVTPSINFVKIEKGSGVVQFGLNNRIGPNGVGGVTIDGRISGYRVTDTKPNGPVTVYANITAPFLLGPATLSMIIDRDGTARATIVGSFGSRLTFAGQVYGLDEAHVFQGNSLLF